MRVRQTFLVRVLSTSVFALFNALLCLAALVCLCTETNAQAIIPGPTIAVSGGITVLDPNNDIRNIPNIFTWKSLVSVTGAKWSADEVLTIHMRGPLTTPGVTPTDRVVRNADDPALGKFITSAQGTFGGHFVIPYDFGVLGVFGQNGIPRPGRYEIYVNFGNPITNFRAIAEFNLSPDTIVNNNGVLGAAWGSARGGRDGPFADHSPERTDPEWVSVWNEEPVQIYATVAETDLNGFNQPSFISHEDYTGSHYGHDANVGLVPDERDRWVLGTANFQGPAGDAGTGRIELEWEEQNNGSASYVSYEHGNIGMPLFVMPTAGDRVFTVGRWALDHGHPDSGDRTEIHPARLLATMRQRNTAVPFSGTMTRASQVDIYVSGHGGGANQFPDGLSAALDNNGMGGGRISGVMNLQDEILYERFGPADSGLAGAIAGAWNIVASSGQINGTAGPSAFGWTKGPEERPVNDMDYDFDVPLPLPPAGATQPLVQVTQYLLHTTAVNQVITYTSPDPTTGLPTAAHIHLPYNGADSGIYARTLNFYWNTFSPPGEHFVVRMDDIFTNLSNIDGPYPLYLWTEVDGQWVFLSVLNPTFASLPSPQTLIGGLSAATFDVYVDPADTLRVYTQGYLRRPLDDLFGSFEIGRPAYQSGLDLAEAFVLGGGPVDLGGAVYKSLTTPIFPSTVPRVVGHHQTLGNYFNMDFTVSHVDAPPHMMLGGLPADFGTVCPGSSADHVIPISNTGENLLVVNSINVSGAGFSLQPPLVPPIYVPTGQQPLNIINVRFSPTAVSQGAGTITFNSNDPSQPSLQVPLSGTGLGCGCGSPASDASGSVSVTRSGYSFSVVSKRFAQIITLKNTGMSPIAGPISLVLDSLSGNASLFNATGMTLCAAPAGSPYVTIAGPLSPGASATAIVQFTDPTKTAITYTTRVLAGGNP